MWGNNIPAWLKKVPLELLFWIVGLLFLAYSDPHQHHFSLCPIAAMGFDWCPGCGLGRSISYLFRGDVQGSLSMHWFGIPALIIIVMRIIRLTKNAVVNRSFGF